MKIINRLICFIAAFSIAAGANAYAAQGIVKTGETGNKVLRIYPNGNMLVASGNQKCMFIGANGEPLTRDVYEINDNIAVYRDAGLTVLSVNGRFGALDDGLNELIPFIYDRIYSFHRGYAVAVYNGRFGVIAKNGDVVLPFKYEVIEYTVAPGVFKTRLNGSGLTNASGRELIQNKYSYLGTLSEDMISYSEGPKLGFLTVNGSIAVKAEYDDASFYKNGYASVLLNGKWAVIDKKGKLVTDFIYDRPVFFDDNGLAELLEDEVTTVFFSRAGIGFDENHAFYGIGGERYIHYSAIDESWSIIESGSGKTISGGFHTLYPLYTTEYLVAKSEKDGLYGLVDKSGKELLSFEFDAISNIGTYLVAESGGVTSIYNSRLKLIARELKNSIGGVIGGYFVFRENRREGLCDSKGNIVIKAEYDSVRGGFGGLVLAERKGKTEILKLPEYKPAITALAGENRLMIDGAELVTDAALYNESGRLMFPLKWLTHTLGIDCSFVFDDGTKSVLITYGGVSLSASAGSRELVTGDKQILMDFPAIMINDVLYIQLEYLSGAFGIEYHWNGELKRLSFGGL